VTLRTMLGIGWSMLFGLAGGWLVLMPWALNLQGSGDWTTVTKDSFWTGLGLLALCLIGLVVTIALVVRSVSPTRRGQDQTTEEDRAEQQDLDRALLQIATKLAADLDGSASGQAVPSSNVSATDGGTPVPQRRVEQ
jgi:hypothetical protein